MVSFHCVPRSGNPAEQPDVFWHRCLRYGKTLGKQVTLYSPLVNQDPLFNKEIHMEHAAFEKFFRYKDFELST